LGGTETRKKAIDSFPVKKNKKLPLLTLRDFSLFFCSHSFPKRREGKQKKKKECEGKTCREKRKKRSEELSCDEVTRSFHTIFSPTLTTRPMKKKKKKQKEKKPSTSFGNTHSSHRGSKES